jgi:hypothetical protein
MPPDGALKMPVPTPDCRFMDSLPIVGEPVGWIVKKNNVEDGYESKKTG